MSCKKSIAVSACLLGHKVRYDGQHQANLIVVQDLSVLFNIIPVCPEMEIGLGVPREKIELHQQGDDIRLLSTTQPVVDLTARMLAYAQRFVERHLFAGLVLKDKSPSCGVGNCKIWDKHGHMQHHADGIFAATIMRLKPGLPMLQSNELGVESALQSFVQRVNAYAS